MTATLCTVCLVEPRLEGSRSTWCRECKNAWQRGYRAGVRKQVRVPEPVPQGDCLIWQGYVLYNGYGRVHASEGVTAYAHRAAWEKAYGAIPDGLTVDHACEVKLCVNVEHLQLVTRGRNTELYYERRKAVST